VENPVHVSLNEQVIGYIVALEPESLVGDDAAEVAGITGEKGVETDDLPSLVQQPLTQVRADEARASGD
jgi:hypothetical protein